MLEWAIIIILQVYQHVACCVHSAARSLTVRHTCKIILLEAYMMMTGIYDDDLQRAGAPD